MTDKQAVVLFSGGQDSTTCLAWAIKEFGRANVHPVSFDYGQRHMVELKQAHLIANALGVRSPLTIPVLVLKFLGGAALTNSSIDVQAKATQTSGNQFAYKHGLPSTFVPGRNMLFFTLAAAYGAQLDVYDLVTGVCEADASGYPDCRASFVSAAEATLSEALDDVVTIHAPLLERDKAETWELSKRLGVLDVVVELSHTCYHGDRSNKFEWGYGCGECPACVERAKGFAEFTEKETLV
jgi:7-cyano-7-deazaguanine synthase